MFGKMIFFNNTIFEKVYIHFVYLFSIDAITCYGVVVVPF